VILITDFVITNEHFNNYNNIAVTSHCVGIMTSLVVIISYLQLI